MDTGRVGRSVFNQRVRASLASAKISEKEIKNFKGFPEVMARFYLATPHALQILDSDLSLLERLDYHFTRSGQMLPLDLAKALVDKGLFMRHFGLYASPVFYELSGATDAEVAALDKLLDDFLRNPDSKDIKLCFEVFGIDLIFDKSRSISNQEAATLSEVFRPYYSRGVQGDELKALTKYGITQIVIIDFSESEAKKDKESLFISRRLLNTASFIAKKAIMIALET
ncbi:hypothetical protein HZB07_03770 [Candidatus Saganbacteria bacterium]|nr:hypothetical protein [Candidatus Saganbacteria bacterium]